MEPKYNFKELMKERHSCRKFQSKPIPEEILKDIITISLDSPSWCNSQPWNIYVASGKTMEEIRKEWISKSEQKVKGYADIPPGHRTDTSERSQSTMAKFFEQWEKLPKKDTEDHGLDSIPAYMSIMYPDVLRKYLKISDKEDIVIGIALGYEEKCQLNDYRSVKLTLDEVCHFFD